MNDFDLDSFRIFLHLLAVSVWVGGQIVLAALVPFLRGISPDAPRLVADRFGQVAWPFFTLAVVTGIWNLAEVDIADRSTAYSVTLAVKLLAVTVAGIAAAWHSNTTSAAVRGITGAAGLIGSVVALAFGVMMVWG